MKKVALVLALVLASCSERSTEAVVTALNGIDGRNGIDGSSCYVEESEYGTKLSCTDGSFAVISNGKDGSSCSSSETEDGVDIICGNEVVASLENGEDGLDGSSGQDGRDGLAGQSCTTQSTIGGAIITCGSTTSMISNGQNGSNTSNATISNYGSSSCTLIVGTNNYVEVGNNNISIYTSSSCSSNSKLAEVSQGEAYWVSSNSLATHSSGSLRVITFNQ